MRLINKHISILLLSFTMTGFFISIAHFHSDGLLCLEHAKEEHFTENELLCPLDALAADDPLLNKPDLTYFISGREVLIIPEYIRLSLLYSAMTPGRSPPLYI